MKKYLEIGKIVGTKGLSGELKVQPWCDSPEFFTKFNNLYFDSGKTVVKIISSKVKKNIAVIKIEDINNLDEALVLVNKVLYVNRDDIKLEEGRYFIQDLIGLTVLDMDRGRIYGKITDVFKTGANDVYEVTSGESKKYLVPAIPDVVIKLDLENEKVFIRLIEGIFEDED